MCTLCSPVNLRNFASSLIRITFIAFKTTIVTTALARILGFGAGMRGTVRISSASSPIDYPKGSSHCLRLKYIATRNDADRRFPVGPLLIRKFPA